MRKGKAKGAKAVITGNDLRTADTTGEGEDAIPGSEDGSIEGRPSAGIWKGFLVKLERGFS